MKIELLKKWAKRKNIELKFCVKEIDAEFKEKPKIENREDALAVLEILIKANGVTNDRLALYALRDAVKRGLA